MWFDFRRLLIKIHNFGLRARRDLSLDSVEQARFLLCAVGIICLLLVEKLIHGWRRLVLSFLRGGGLSGSQIQRVRSG